MLFVLLLTEGDRSCHVVHGVYDGKRFKVIAEVANASAAVLEALLNDDTDALDRGACRLGDGDQPLTDAFFQSFFARL